MVLLGGIVLPDQTLWTDRYDWQPVAQSTIRSLAGTQTVFTAPLIAGQPITLEWQERVAWLTQAQVDALSALASQPGAVSVLNYHGVILNVIVRHHDSPALSVQPIWPLADTFTGMLKLETVTA
jgi:hypothetical protein